MPLTASGVVTWVPDVCPDGRVPHASADSANYQDAQDFDVTNSEYYQASLLAAPASSGRHGAFCACFGPFLCCCQRRAVATSSRRRCTASDCLR